jgi:CelD/BcsL family acetyltransferase involved in cellulose biosynthesis
MTEESAFDELSAEWNTLLDDSSHPTYFLRPEWNRLWWQHSAPTGSRLNIIACRDGDGRLVGLAPLYARQHRTLGIPSTRDLLFLGTGIELKTSEHLDIITRRGYEADASRAMARALVSLSDWDRLWLSSVADESTTLPHFVDALGERQRMVASDRAPYIDTSSDWETLKRSYGRSMRRNLEYYSRRLFKSHACQFTRVEGEHDMEVAMDELVRLHQARWESKGYAGAFRDGSLEPLLRAAVREGQPQGRIRLWTFEIDGRIEAVLLGFLDNGVLHYFQKGFNPAFAKDDLGTAMLALCVRDCTRDPEVRAFDFMGGGARYKDIWARQARINVVREVTRLNWRSLLFTTRERAVGAGAAAYRAIAPMRLRTLRREWLRSVGLKRAKGANSTV